MSQMNFVCQNPYEVPESNVLFQQFQHNIRMHMKMKSVNCLKYSCQIEDTRDLMTVTESV